MHERPYLVTDLLEIKWLKTLDVHLNAIFGKMGNDIYKLNVYCTYCTWNKYM